MTFIFLAGCSTNPCADVQDFFFPGKLGPTTVQPYGGVSIPQGPILPGAPMAPVVGAPVPIAPVGVVPPAAPLPGNTSPEVPAFPPIPPNPPGRP